MPRPAGSPAAASPRAPRLWALAWPLCLELALAFAASIAGTVLAARLSDAAGAAFSLALQLYMGFFVLYRVIGAGVSVVVAQALGAGDRAKADGFALASLGAATRLGLALAAANLALHAPLVALLQAPPEVAPQARGLLLALAPVLVFDAWVATLAAVMRAHLLARTSLAVMTVMHGVNLALVAPLMLGAAAWPGVALGLTGYAASLFASRVVAVALLLWLLGERLGLRPHLADWWRWRRGDVAAVVRIGAPGAAENLGYRLAFLGTLAVVGSMGAQALATHAYVQQILLCILLAGLATGLAAEVAVGHLVGAGALREAHALVRRAQLRGLAVTLGVALAAALAGPWLLRLFTRDEAIIAAGATLMWWTVLLECGRTFNLIVINALRAAGDVRYPLVAGLGSMALVLGAGSWVLGSAMGLGLVGVWIAYAADEWLRGLLMWRRWLQLRWTGSARRVHRAMHTRGLAARV